MTQAKAVSFQKVVNSSDEYNECIAFRGLTVVEICAEWCGKCKCIEPTLKRMAMELDDKPVKFIVATAEKVEALQEYNGKPKPTFKFFKNGDLLETIEGVDMPKICDLILLNAA